MPSGPAFIVPTSPSRNHFSFLSPVPASEKTARHFREAACSNAFCSVGFLTACSFPSYSPKSNTFFRFPLLMVTMPLL